jgi:hypothetical protein
LSLVEISLSPSPCAGDEERRRTRRRKQEEREQIQKSLFLSFLSLAASFIIFFCHALLPSHVIKLF